MFSLFNFSSIFPWGSADPICPYVRTPMGERTLSQHCSCLGDNDLNYATTQVEFTTAFYSLSVKSIAPIYCTYMPTTIRTATHGHCNVKL